MKNIIKKVIDFCREVLRILSGSKIRENEEQYEEILMLNRQYLSKYSGSKRYVKCPKNQ
jgi:hypothetical protein